MPPTTLDRLLRDLPAACPAPAASDGEALFLRANALKGEQRTMDAIACYGAALRSSPAHTGAYNNLGNTLKRAHAQALPLCAGAPCSEAALLQAASHALRTVIGLNPRHANAYTNLASLCRAEHRFDEAIALGRAATRIEPRHVTAYENLGRALQADSAPAALPIASSSSGAWRHSAGGGWRRRERLQDAVEAYRSVLRLAGVRSSRDAYRGLGYSLLWMGREDEARGVLSAALEAGVWSTRGQYPGELDARLASTPFPPPRRVQCLVDAMHERAPQLVGEASALLARDEALRAQAGGAWGAGLFSPEREGLHSPQHGFAYYDVLARCATADGREATPATCSALDALLATTGAQVALARISRLQAGVTLSPHTGLRNARWRLHLGLQLPDPAVVAQTPALRVGGAPPRRWEVGRAFVFDDSFEHAVTWSGGGADAAGGPGGGGHAIDLSAAAARLVLIVDFQHPDLAPVCAD